MVFMRKSHLAEGIDTFDTAEDTLGHGWEHLSGARDRRERGEEVRVGRDE